MVVFIHGWVCLPCVNLDGTLLSMVFCIAVLNACHIDSTFLSMFLCVVFKIVKSYVILYIHMSVFFHKNIFLRTGFGLNGLHAISSRTISWSLDLIDGSGLHHSLNAG